MSSVTATEVGRAAVGDQALAVPAEPASGLDASRSDPSRVVAELARMKCLFQLRAVCTALQAPAHAIVSLDSGR